VFDRSDLGRHAVLVALEVDQPVLAFVASTLVPRRDPAIDVPPGPLLERTGQRLLGLAAGDLGEVGDAGAPLPGRGRLELSDRHVLWPLRFENFDGVAGRERHHGALLVGPPPGPEASPL